MRYSSGRWLGSPLSEFPDGLFSEAQFRLEAGDVGTLESPFGSDRTAIVSSSAVRSGRGDVIGTLLIAHDITDRAKAEAAVRRSEELYRTLVETSRDAVIVTNADDAIITANGRAAELFGVPSAEAMIGESLLNLAAVTERERLRQAIDERRTNDVLVDAEFLLERRSGEQFPAEVSLSQIVGHGGSSVSGLMFVARDVSERKRAQETIRHLAFHDSLTGLANRPLLMEHLSLVTARRLGAGQEFAILYMDLDKMKPINDKFGHAAGDEALRRTSERIKSLIRGEDVLARVGGDEFILLISHMSGEQAVQIANRILELVRQPIVLGEVEFSLGVSIGIACYPTDAETSQDLIGLADAAMYEAKTSGGNAWRMAGSLETIPLLRE